jgi:hypothetical protein
MIKFAIFIAVVLVVVGYWWWAKRRLMAALGADFAKYNEGAFKETRVDSSDPRYWMIERLALEFRSKAGQLAVSVAADGAALHHINQNGTFSKKGPYYVSRRTRNWRATGRSHLIRTFRGKGSWGFQSSNPGQGAGIHEMGIAVLEYDTKRYPPVDIWDYSTIHSRQNQKLELIDP